MPVVSVTQAAREISGLAFADRSPHGRLHRTLPMMRSVFRIDVLLVGVLAVGAAAFLYNKHLNLEIDEGRRNGQAALYEQRRQCAADGKKWAQEYFQEEASAALSHQLSAWDDPEFHYSVELSTCLTRTRSVDIQSFRTYQHARITDLSSNRAVLESYVSLRPDPDKPDGSLKEEQFDSGTVRDNLSRAEFVKRADALMAK
jgi:hypothetical protein